VGWKLKSYLLRLLTLVRDEVKKENISRFKEKEGNEMCKQYVLSMIYTVCIVYGLVHFNNYIYIYCVLSQSIDRPLLPFSAVGKNHIKPRNESDATPPRALAVALKNSKTRRACTPPKISPPPSCARGRES
jgi:hypothetical protein